MWKFAIDIGPPTEWTGVGLKRWDKDWFLAAPPKSKLTHSVAVTNCRLDFRTPLDSLAKGPHLLAGKLVVILNSEPTRTNKKIGVRPASRSLVWADLKTCSHSERKKESDVATNLRSKEVAGIH